MKTAVEFAVVGAVALLVVPAYMAAGAIAWAVDILAGGTSERKAET